MTEKHVQMTIHFAGGAPLVLDDVPAKQALSFRKSLTEDPTIWRGLASDDGRQWSINRAMVTWVEVE
jgi:hypothetical protein